ncbi:unnamed protein product [Didymodactylos carnosus]|uniref:Uncharacterized protein n=1 Tax=Didymodactylos carnosus TaxID=1234261 RepID=A0A815ZB17_9BILA|nr:unnamed protein product [Didymodactylos carnosus]CAF1580457.1 unnamed protein product [Didymodactylos carnosus]CAF4360684.1 unnamed protein product [Didymodactylos carnosus]CAF4447665.1 unnamed protein product [Didymodactylos carnosus]
MRSSSVLAIVVVLLVCLFKHGNSVPVEMETTTAMTTEFTATESSRKDIVFNSTEGEMEKPRYPHDGYCGHLEEACSDERRCCPDFECYHSEGRCIYLMQ